MGRTSLKWPIFVLSGRSGAYTSGYIGIYTPQIAKIGFNNWWRVCC